MQLGSEYIVNSRLETIFGNWNPFKNDEKCFLFYFKSSLRSQIYLSFCLDFLIMCKNSLIKEIRLISKFATYRSQRFYSIFNKRFDHLETLLTICRTKKVLPAGSVCGPIVSIPSLNAPKWPCYPESIMFQFQICYQSYWNVSWKTKININFKGQTWVRPPAKCWVKGFTLPHKYHVPNCFQRFWHTLAN